MRETATYAYCVAAGATPPRLARAPRGLPEMTRPRALAVTPGTWLVVADAPLSRYGAAPIEAGLRDLDWISRCAVAHEAVVEHVARTGVTVVPSEGKMAPVPAGGGGRQETGPAAPAASK